MLKVLKNLESGISYPNFGVESNINTMDNFFKRPVGAAVLFLNDFHFGKRLNDLNRCARLVPKDVKGFASLLTTMPDADAEHVGAIIDELVFLADQVDGTDRIFPQ